PGPPPLRASGPLPPPRLRPLRFFRQPLDRLEALLQPLLHLLGRYGLSGLGIERMVVVSQATHRLLHLLLTLLTLLDLLLPVAFGLLGPAETLLEVRRPARRADSGLVLLVAVGPVPNGFLDLLQL